VLLESLRKEVHYVNLMLPRAGLVTMHSGNASGYDPASQRVVIKPSGVDYDAMRAEDLVVVDLAGNVVEGTLRPSVDTPHHLFLYRRFPELGGVIHTHSPYATSFAALGLSIPCALTAIADEFGCEIPCAPYVDNQGDHIGESIVRYRNRAPAVLLAGHGVFAFDATPRKALKAAVMVEDVAKTIHLAMLKGNVRSLPESEIEKWYTRYHSTYGQKEEPLGSGA
jgi:L-ribulose-5-phosphate 4-epimerase